MKNQFKEITQNTGFVMRKTTKKFLSIGLLIVIIGFFVWYVYGNIEDFKTIELVNPYLLGVLFVTSIITTIAYGFLTKTILEAFKIKLRFKEWFGITCVTNFYNLITPFRGGMITRAVYLKKKHNFSYTNFLSSLLGVYALQYCIISFLGIISIGLIYLKYGIFNAIVLLIFLAVFVPFGIIILFRVKFPKSKNKVVNKFFEIGNGWNIIRGQKRTLSVSIFVIFASMMINVINIIILYNVFGIKLTIVQGLFLVTISAVVGLAQITPGNLGVSEAVSVLSALVIGITPVQSIPVIILNRLIQTIVLVILGPLYSYILLKNGNQKD